MHMLTKWNQFFSQLKLCLLPDDVNYTKFDFEKELFLEKIIMIWNSHFHHSTISNIWNPFWALKHVALQEDYAILFCLRGMFIHENTRLFFFSCRLTMPKKKKAKLIRCVSCNLLGHNAGDERCSNGKPGCITSQVRHTKIEVNNQRFDAYWAFKFNLFLSSPTQAHEVHSLSGSDAESEGSSESKTSSRSTRSSSAGELVHAQKKLRKFHCSLCQSESHRAPQCPLKVNQA